MHISNELQGPLPISWIGCTRCIISVKFKLIRQVGTPVESHMLMDRRMDERTDGQMDDTRHTIIRPTFVGRIKTYEDPQDRYDLPTVCIANVFFVLEKFVTLSTVAWFQVCRWKCTIPAGDSAIVIVNGTALFHLRSNPGRSLMLASISSGLHRLHSQYADALSTLEVGHQQSCYWSPKPEYFFSSIKRVKITTSSSRGQWVNAIWPVRLWEFSISRYDLTSRGIPIVKIKSTV